MRDRRPWHAHRAGTLAIEWGLSKAFAEGTVLLVLDPVALLEHAPGWLRQSVLNVTQGKGSLGRVYDRFAHPYESAAVPVLPEVSTAPVRMLIGPANEAEQGFQWARAAERTLPDVQATALLGLDPGVYQVRADLRVPLGVYLRSPEWHERFEQYLAAQTHVIWESCLPLLGRRYGNEPLREQERLAAFGVKGAFLFHGTDIRSPAQHAEESEWSPFRRAGLPVKLLEEKTQRNRHRAVESGAPIFVSTPDLLRHAPGSVWCPIVVNPAEWATERPSWPRNSRPVVVHAPSNPLFKGTDAIEPVLHKLEGEGLIEYRRVQGVPYSQMAGFYAEADIVLDHFLIGNYSMVTIEGLAAGCLAIGHVDEHSRAAVREATGVEVPVLEANIDTLESVLRGALKGGAEIEAMRKRGPEFVELVHNGRFSAAAMASFLGVTPQEVDETV